MSTDQNRVPTSVNMDARNFLRAINSSAQSKVAFFESVVQRLGQEVKKDFKLTALHPASLIFEDVKNHDYYTGEIKKDGQRYHVDNIKKITVVEEKKADLFAKNCSDLVEAISEQDFKTAEKVFNKIELQRFRSRVIPESGWVTTRDGDAHFIKTQKDVIEESRVPSIIKAFADAVSDSVEVSNGNIISGTFTETGENFTIPVDEYTRRRIVARKMRQVAESAHKSPSFQKLVTNIAGLVSEKKIAEAVEVAAKFLREEQEFCLLGHAGIQNLVESTLATQMEFNSFLVNDVATLMHKTNMKVNRDSIVECWSKTAQKAQNAELLSKTKNLAESNDFASEYEVFLESVFNEANDIDSSRAKAYVVTMKVIKNVLKRVEGQEQLVQDIDKMVSALEAGEPSTDVIYQTEELLAGISDTIVDRIQTLDSYDRMPGVEAEVPEEEAGEEEAGEPVPLPELSGEEAGELEAEAPLAPETAQETAPETAEPALVGVPESKNAKGKPIVEGEFTSIEKMSVLELQEELLGWQTDGHIYLKEDGFDDCFDQLNRFVDRCRNLGPTAKVVAEEFERIRDVMIDSGNDVSLDLPSDPYKGKVDLKEGAKISADYGVVAEDLGGLSGPEKGAKHGGDASGMSELQSGEALSDQSAKKVSGTDATGTPNASGAEEHADGLDMSKEHQGKSKGLADKNLKKASGADAAGTPNASGAEKHEGGLGMAKDFQKKSKSIAEDNFIDKLAATLDEEKVDLGKVSYKAGGGVQGKNDLDMAELQGKDGVEGANTKEVSGEDADGVPAGGKLAKNDADMAKDHQDKTDGLAEGEEAAEEVVSDEPSGEDVAAATEDQRKGPRVHRWGRKRAALAPREVEEGKSNDAAVTEDVAVVYSADESIDGVIGRVVDAMAKHEPMFPAPALELPPAPALELPPAPMLPVAPAPEMETPAEEGEADESDESEEAEETLPVGEAIDKKLAETVVENEEACIKCKKVGESCICPCPDCGKDECAC